MAEKLTRKSTQENAAQERRMIRIGVEYGKRDKKNRRRKRRNHRPKRGNSARGTWIKRQRLGKKYASSGVTKRGGRGAGDLVASLEECNQKNREGTEHEIF